MKVAAMDSANGTTKSLISGWRSRISVSEGLGVPGAKQVFLEAKRKTFLRQMIAPANEGRECAILLPDLDGNLHNSTSLFLIRRHGTLFGADRFPATRLLPPIAVNCSPTWHY